MNKNVAFKKDDYVRYNYCGEYVTGRIIELRESRATVKVSLGNKRGEAPTFDEVEADLTELKPLKLKPKSEDE